MKTMISLTKKSVLVYLPLIAIFLMVVLTGCEQQEPISDYATPIEGYLSKSVLAQTLNANEDIAISIARNFKYGFSRNLNRSVQNDITSVTPIYNKDGATTMYVVEFGQDNGFVVVSASFMTSPIISSSSDQSFKSTVANSVILARYYERVNEHITQTLSYPEDSVYNHYHEWKSLLGDNSYQPFANPSLDYNNRLIMETIWAWEERGYEVYDARYWLREQIHLGYLEGLQEELDKFSNTVDWAGGVPMNTISFIVIERTTTVTDSNAKRLTTRWNTMSPYNNAVPNGNPLSSHAVAVGQILNHYKDKSIYSYSSDQSNPLRNNDEISNFLYSVAINLNTRFGAKRSESTLTDMTSALKNTYGCNVDQYDFEPNKVVVSIDNDGPVIINQINADGTEDAGIIDAHQSFSTSVTYSLMIPGGDPSDASGPYFAHRVWQNPHFDTGINFSMDGVLIFYTDIDNKENPFQIIGLRQRR